VQFLAASIGPTVYATDQRVKLAFEFFDKDKDGFISREELKMALVGNKTGVSEVEVEAVFNKLDESFSGKIDLTAFKNLMQVKEHI
jgi:calcium-dependent protein kinase